MDFIKANFQIVQNILGSAINRSIQLVDIYLGKFIFLVNYLFGYALKKLQ